MSNSVHKSLVSCSVWEDWGPGSSQHTMTRAPSRRLPLPLKRGGKATFNPTCFIMQTAFLPDSAAPKATSMAHRSFVDHSACIFPFSLLLNSTTPGKISELGVPGYAAASSKPASTRPRAIAKFPIMTSFIFCLYLVS